MMDMPLPLLERLKRRLALPSFNTSPHKQVILNPNNDTTTNSDGGQLDAVEPPLGAGKIPRREVTGNCSNSSSVCSRSVTAADRKKSKRCHDLARSSSGNNRSQVSGLSSSNSIFWEDTGGVSTDNLRNISSTGSNCHVRKDAATELRLTRLVNEDGYSLSGEGSQSSRREGSRSTAKRRSVAAPSLSHSAGPRAHTASEAEEEQDTIPAATGRAVLSARCAWTSSLQRSGNTRWVCHGLYAHEGFHCVYLLRSLRTPRCTYIGYSINPLYRLRQHNGDVSHGGAWKTRRHRPWALVLVVHGFPHAVAALQFEWRWQRTIPAPRQASPLTGGIRKKRPGVAAGSSITTSSVTASATPARNSGETGGYGYLQPSLPALRRESGSSRSVIGGKSVGFYKNRSVMGKFQQVGSGKGMSPVPRETTRRSPSTSCPKMTASDSCTEMRGVSTSDAAAYSGKPLLNIISSAGEDSLHKADMDKTRLTGEEKGMRKAQEFSVSAYACDDCSDSLNNLVHVPSKCSSPIRENGSTRKKACVEGHKRACGIFELTANAASVNYSTTTEQHAPYRLSRTGNGIVARVGLRLQTLVALLHKEPFRHMPLGVHVVDAYTAAPYFRFLVRERKLNDPHQRQQWGDMTSCCNARRTNSRAQSTRRSAWMLLQRSLVVSFGEPSLLLPLISRSKKKCREDRKIENNTSNSNGTHSRPGADIPRRGAPIDDEHSFSITLNHDTIQSSHSESDSTTLKYGEDEGLSHQQAATSINPTTASRDDTLLVEDNPRTQECLAPLVGDCVPCRSHLPVCRLCGCEFLREPRERPASRCGNCLCFYHLTCLGRSVFDKKPQAPVWAEVEAGLDKCSVGVNEYKAPPYKHKSCGSSGAGEGCSPVHRYPGLVPAEVKCACCGFVRSWAEVLADGVVLSADTIQEPSSSAHREDDQQDKP